MGYAERRHLDRLAEQAEAEDRRNDTPEDPHAGAWCQGWQDAGRGLEPCLSGEGWEETDAAYMAGRQSWFAAHPKARTVAA